MDGAACRVALEVREVQRLGDQALPGERGVAVDEDGQDFLAFRVARLVAVLFGADAALDDGVHPLQVAGVEGKREMELFASPGDPVRGIPEVVLHVAAPHQLLRVLVLELGEDGGEVLLEDVGEDVQAPAVRHADDDLLASALAEFLDQPIHQRDQALAALEREALSADVLLVQERLERLRVGEAPEDAQLLLAAELDLVPGRLHPLLQPAADDRVLAVHELGPDSAAIGPLEARDDLAQGQRRRAHVEVAGGEQLVQVLAGQAEVLGLQLGRRRLEQAERIDVGEQVAADPVRVDQLGHRLLLLFGVQPLRVGCGGR